MIRSKAAAVSSTVSDWPSASLRIARERGVLELVTMWGIKG
jgi:hypothetical protein